MSAVKENESTTAQNESGSDADGARGAAPSRQPDGAARWIVGLMLVLGGLVLMLSEPAIRELEVRLTTWLAGMSFATETMFAWNAGDPAVGFTMGQGWFAAQATALCGAAYFAGIILIAGGALAVVRLVSWPRALTISAIGVIAIFVLNQVRLLLVLLTMGATAQQGAHPLDDAFGVVAMIIATLGALAFLFFAARGARSRASRA